MFDYLLMYIDEMAPMMTVVKVLFIIGIVTAALAVICYILAPIYKKGKAAAAKTLAQIMSTTTLISGILLIVAFILSALVMLTTLTIIGETEDVEMMKFYLSLVTEPVEFGMPIEVLSGDEPLLLLVKSTRRIFLNVSQMDFTVSLSSFFIL